MKILFLQMGRYLSKKGYLCWLTCMLWSWPAVHQSTVIVNWFLCWQHFSFSDDFTKIQMFDFRRIDFTMEVRSTKPHSRKIDRKAAGGVCRNKYFLPKVGRRYYNDIILLVLAFLFKICPVQICNYDISSMQMSHSWIVTKATTTQIPNQIKNPLKMKIFLRKWKNSFDWFLITKDILDPTWVCVDLQYIFFFLLANFLPRFWQACLVILFKIE